MDSTKINDVADLTKLSLSTFLNIGQMARYRYLYTLGKKLQIDNPVQVNACKLAHNRDKMIYHTCFAGLGIAGLLAIGIGGIIAGKQQI